MQINLLQMFGQAMGLQTGPAAPGVPGFAEFLLAASPPGAPPAWPPGPPIPGVASETGKELSIKPNAGESELDPDPKNLSTDRLLSAFGYALVPQVAPELLPTQPEQSGVRDGGIRPFEPGLPLSPSQPFNWSWHHASNPKVSLPPIDFNRPMWQQRPSWPDFSSFAPHPLPNLPEWHPGMTPWKGAALPSFNHREPTVAVSGLVRQPNAQALDSQMLADLGVVAIEGASVQPAAQQPLDSIEVLSVEAPPRVVSPMAETSQSGATPKTDSPAPTSLFESPQEVRPTDFSAVESVLVQPQPKKTTTQTSPQTSANATIAAEPVVALESASVAKTDNLETRDERAVAPDPHKGRSETVAADPLIKEPIKPTGGSEPIAHKQSPSESVDAESTEPLPKSDSTVNPVQVRPNLPVDRQAEPNIVRPSELHPRERAEVIAQTIDRVERMAIHRPLSQMVIRLMPKELGEITLTIRSAGSRSEATVEATDQRVVHALQAEQPRLNQSLEAKGVSLGSLSFQFNERSQQEMAHAESSKSFVPQASGESTPAQTPVQIQTNTDSLDLVI